MAAQQVTTEASIIVTTKAQPQPGIQAMKMIQNKLLHLIFVNQQDHQLIPTKTMSIVVHYMQGEQGSFQKRALQPTDPGSMCRCSDERLA